MPLAFTLVVPADRAEWGRLHAVGNSCSQSAALYEGDTLVCQLTLTWPAPLPCVPVVASVQGREAGPRD